MYSVSDFKAKAIEFGQAFRSLQDETGTKGRPELEEERQKLIGRGNVIKKSIAYVTSGMDTFTRWGRETLGLDGAEQLQADALGFVPLLPVAGIAGAITLMSGWLSSVYKFNKKLAKVKELEAKGVPSEKAFNLVNKLDTGLNINAKGLAPVLAGGALLFFLMRNK